ncbi:hypothetical protein Tco_0594649, partial [Tanacetum coccineum]
VVSLAGVNDQGGADVQGVLNEEGGDAAVADQVREGDHAAQDEGVDIVRAEGEIQVVVAEKPKFQKRRRKADGASGFNHPPKKLRADHG